MPENITGKLTDKAGPLPVWAWSLILGVGGYAVYKWRKNQTTTAATTTTGTTTTDTATGGTDLTGALITSQYDLNNSLGILDSNVASNTGALAGNTAATNGNTVAVTGKAPVSAQHATTFIVPGAFNSKVSLRTVAAQMLPSDMQSNKNAVQSQLVRLITANPSYKGQTTALGGHSLNWPIGTPTVAKAQATLSSMNPVLAG